MIYSVEISNRMGTVRNRDTYSGNTSFSPNITTGVLAHRNLGKNNLGGVIFGCTDNTMKECLFKQIFGKSLVVHFRCIGIALLTFNVFLLLIIWFRSRIVERTQWNLFFFFLLDPLSPFAILF